MIKLKERAIKEEFGNTIFESVAVGSAYELLRHDLMEHLREIQSELHFKYLRFHGLFHDDMEVVRRAPDGTLAYQWHHVDKITDNMLSVGLKPFFELNSMPEPLASAETYACFWKMNTSEPKDYNEWGDLVWHFVSHMVDRYGLDEVKTWYFEVWNEPNLKGFWPAGMEKYYKLYEYAARAVKKVDSELKVGGPASAGGDYVVELIDYCDKNDVPIDFISTHAYPIGEYCEYREREGSPYELGEYFVGRFKEVKEKVEKSVMPNLEIHWTEWNTQSGNSTKNISWVCNPTVDQQFGGACAAKNMLGVRNLCDSVAYWTASDIFAEPGQSHSVFSCTYGLVNIHGIRKATYNAYKLLRKMRGTVLDCQKDSEYPIGCGMTATEENGVVRIIAYNQHLLEFETQLDWKESVEVALPDGEYIVSSAQIEKGHGSCYETWLEMGAPQNLSKMQEELLRYASMPRYEFSKVTSENGSLKVNFNLKGNEVIYIEIQKADIRALPRNADEATMSAWNKAMMLEERGCKKTPECKKRS